MKEKTKAEKTRIINIRVSNEQYNQFSIDANDKGYTSVSEYVRESVAGKKRSTNALHKKTLLLVTSVQNSLNKLMDTINDCPKSCSKEIKAQITNIVGEVNKIWQN